jgi:hypothetical protein
VEAAVAAEGEDLPEAAEAEVADTLAVVVTFPEVGVGFPAWDLPAEVVFRDRPVEGTGSRGPTDRQRFPPAMQDVPDQGSPVQEVLRGQIVPVADLDPTDLADPTDRIDRIDLGILVDPINLTDRVVPATQVIPTIPDVLITAVTVIIIATTTIIGMTGTTATGTAAGMEGGTPVGTMAGTEDGESWNPTVFLELSSRSVFSGWVRFSAKRPSGRSLAP